MMERALNIVHTESSIGWGGQEIRILEESRGLVDRGHKVTLVAPEEAIISQRAQDYGIDVEEASIFNRNLNSLMQLRKVLAKLKPDVINTHSSTDSWLIAILSALRQTEAPIIRTRHISSQPSRTLTSRLIYRSIPDRVITTGALIKQQVVRVGADPARVEIVPTGIDPLRFRPGDKAAIRSTLGIDERRCVGIVATVRSWKGHRYLMKAISGLNTGEWQLLIVGDGSMRSQLEQEAIASGWTDWCKFVGNQKDVAPWLQAMDIFCLPSYANEGVPQALLQAMLTGLPCITTTAGCITDVAHHGETALVVSPKHSDALRQALLMLAADPILSTRLGQQAREWALSNACLEKMVRRMEQILIETVIQHRSHHKGNT